MRIHIVAVEHQHIVELALRLNQRRIKNTTQSVGIHGSRHEHYCQIRPKHILGFERKGKSQIDAQAALMKFIKNNHSHTFERRVVDKHTLHNALCHNLNAC